MKIKIKFIGIFTLGLFLFLFYMSFIIILFLELLLPMIGLTDNVVAVMIVFFTTFLTGGMFFSIWFIQPIILMLGLINKLSCGDYNEQEVWDMIRNKKGDIKRKYWIYKELITDFDALTEQLKQAETERIHLEKAKQDWVRGISHDIKTPLSYVVGYSSLLLSPDHSWEPSEQQNFLLQINQKGKYIETLIDNLNLSFRLEDKTNPIPLQMKCFNLIPFMEKLIADMLNEDSSMSQSLSLETIDSQLDIEIDEGLLYRAVINLISNAMRHNPDGTDIKVQIKRSKEGYIDISVCDNGIGMSQETIKSLFDKYHDKRISGSGKIDYAGGLGLSIVKSIVEVHHGELLVNSKVNEGTTFIMHLPSRQATCD